MFPTINHIDDILPYIEGKEEINVNTKYAGDTIFKVIQYNVQMPDTFNSSYACECRGIKFWENGEIAFRPLHKFFNKGEKPKMEEELFTPDYRMFEKLDGSMIHFFPIDGEMVAMTKAGISDVSIQCEHELEAHWGGIAYNGFLDTVKAFHDTGVCLVFEYTSPNNRIVLYYNEPELTLIAARNLYSGEYYPIHKIANMLGVRYPKEYTDVSLDDVKEWVDREGVVLVWDNGYRVKAKAEDYVMKHHVIDQFTQEKNVLGLVINDEIDDLVSVLDDDQYEQLWQYHQDVWTAIAETAALADDIIPAMKESMSRKEAAHYFMKESNWDKAMIGLFWKVWDGVDPYEHIVYTVKQNLSSQKAVDKIRSLIRVRWDDFYNR